MKKKEKKLTLSKLLYWLPRVLSILFIVFVSLFALDVFGEPQWFLVLLMHLIPSFILIILTVVAWKFEMIGGIIFVVAGFLFLISSRFESLVISIPVIIIGLLFLMGSKKSFK
jgi:uncharacterized membrane protein YccC